MYRYGINLRVSVCVCCLTHITVWPAAFVDSVKSLHSQSKEFLIEFFGCDRLLFIFHNVYDKEIRQCRFFQTKYSAFLKHLLIFIFNEKCILYCIKSTVTKKPLLKIAEDIYTF